MIPLEEKSLIDKIEFGIRNLKDDEQIQRLLLMMLETNSKLNL